jgi:ABC-type sugar transport system ATPase subunit
MVKFRKVNYTIGEFSLKDITMGIKEGEYFVILGPSGTGKTQLLRVLAGLSKIDNGEIWIGGQRKDHLPPEQREIGFVFQDQVLFPHMTVYDNVAFSLRLRRVKASETRSRVENIADVLGISGLLDRVPTGLSGGEKQRVALARAMVSKPKVLIMDEPYASLDRNLAERLILEGRRLHDRIKQTTIHVTHNQEEAIILADRLCLMESGRIRMIGTPDEVFRKPNSCFVADFVGTANIYRGAVPERTGNGAVKLHYRGKEILCTNDAITSAQGCPAECGSPGSPGGPGDSLNGKVTFCVRPENVNLHTTYPAGLGDNVFDGRIVEIYDRGLMFQSIISIADDFSIVNLTMRRDFIDMNIGSGSRVYLHIDGNSIHIIEGEGDPGTETGKS